MWRICFLRVRPSARRKLRFARRSARIRARLIRQLLIESLLLAGLGGAAGILLSLWTTNFLRCLRRPHIFRSACRSGWTAEFSPSRWHYRFLTPDDFRPCALIADHAPKRKWCRSRMAAAFFVKQRPPASVAESSGRHGNDSRRGAARRSRVCSCAACARLQLHRAQDSAPMAAP